MRRLSPRRVPEQRSRPLQVIGWQGLALLIPVEASAEPGDAEGRVASRAMVHWTAAQLDWLRVTLGSGLCLSHIRNLLPSRR